MLDKYNLTKKENVFLAKKVLVSSIYNSAKLEGINVNYQDTKTILDGANVPSLRLDEINCILNLRDAWNFVLSNIDEAITLDFICKINSFVSRNESLEWGVLRTGKVGINGVDYIPDIPNEAKIIADIKNIMEEKNITRRSLVLMLYLMRTQVFWDGNKRTSMIVANKIMIENGCGVITIKEEYFKEFNSLLTEYYNTNKMESLLKFLYNNCIFGMEI
ncbi:MAG: Fic family protein [Clostridium sp.]|nr:Fic family protein [Clostridium sp.]